MPGNYIRLGGNVTGRMLHFSVCASLQNHCKIGFRGTHCNEALLPGLSEIYVPVLESVMDEDLDPHPCQCGEDEEFFKSRPMY